LREIDHSDLNLIELVQECMSKIKETLVEVTLDFTDRKSNLLNKLWLAGGFKI
jgi:hypothetical protein